MKYSEENYLDKNGEPDIQRLVNDMLADLEEIRESDPIFYEKKVTAISNVLSDMINNGLVTPDDSTIKLIMNLGLQRN